jgi:hypothetical protein
LFDAGLAASQKTFRVVLLHLKGIECYRWSAGNKMLTNVRAKERRLQRIEKGCTRAAAAAAWGVAMDVPLMGLTAASGEVGELPQNGASR